MLYIPKYNTYNCMLTDMMHPVYESLWVLSGIRGETIWCQGGSNIFDHNEVSWWWWCDVVVVQDSSWFSLFLDPKLTIQPHKYTSFYNNDNISCLFVC